MNNEKFIKETASYVQKYAPKYGITCISAPLAQMILESASGTSKLATEAHNLTGLKFKESVSELPAYIKTGSEQNKDGSYTSSVMKWCRFSSNEKGVEGYFKFLNCKRYENLKGVSDPRKYLELIKSDGYATSLKYVDNLMNVIKQYNLTQYDKGAATAQYYRVQVGAYKAKKNADLELIRVKNAGFDAMIKQYDNLYKIQMGAYSTEANAAALKEKAIKAGFEAIVVYN